MKIQVASLTLRFYKYDGWTKAKVRKLLVSSKMEITYRKDNSSEAKKDLLGDLSYYAVYENSGHKVFKESEMRKHTIEDEADFGGIDWYIKKDETKYISTCCNAKVKMSKKKNRIIQICPIEIIID